MHEESAKLQKIAKLPSINGLDGIDYIQLSFWSSADRAIILEVAKKYI